MQLPAKNSNKSLEELEGTVWVEEDFPTELIRRCCSLRKVPLQNLAEADLRILIGQQIGLAYLIPLAIPILSKNILVECIYYPGDLLSAVLSVPINFWQSHKPPGMNYI